MLSGRIFVGFLDALGSIVEGDQADSGVLPHPILIQILLSFILRCLGQ